jgi:hypothetical protein
MFTRRLLSGYQMSGRHFQQRLLPARKSLCKTVDAVTSRKLALSTQELVPFTLKNTQKKVYVDLQAFTEDVNLIRKIMNIPDFDVSSTLYLNY